MSRAGQRWVCRGSGIPVDIAPTAHPDTKTSVTRRSLRAIPATAALPPRWSWTQRTLLTGRFRGSCRRGAVDVRRADRLALPGRGRSRTKPRHLRIRRSGAHYRPSLPLAGAQVFAFTRPGTKRRRFSPVHSGGLGRWSGPAAAGAARCRDHFCSGGRSRAQPPCGPFARAGALYAGGFT